MIKETVIAAVGDVLVWDEHSGESIVEFEVASEGFLPQSKISVKAERLWKIVRLFFSRLVF